MFEDVDSKKFSLSQTLFRSNASCPSPYSQQIYKWNISISFDLMCQFIHYPAAAFLLLGTFFGYRDFTSWFK